MMMRFSHYDGLTPKGQKTGGGGGGSVTSSHNYSTEPQVVGKWINGRDVFEQTIKIVNETLIEGFGNNYELIYCSGSYTADNNNNKASIPSQWSSLLVDNSTKNLRFVTSDGALNYNDFNYVTIRYIEKESEV